MNPALLAALDAGAMVVTPNRRLARFIHREFDLVQRQRGSAAWPTPSILPYPQWLERLWDDAVAAESVRDAPLLLTPPQSALQWRHIVDADVDRVPLFDGRGAAALAADAWSIVHQWGSAGESWRAWHVRDGELDDPAMFARWADAYAARLRATGARDLALVPDALAASAVRMKRRLPPTVAAGFVELTPQQERLFVALREAGAEMRPIDTLPEIDARVTRATAATPREEIAAALAWARERALACPEARIGIVIENLMARREEVVALAEEVLCPAAALNHGTSRAPFEVSLGPPLAAVPLVSTALDLIALADGSLSAGAAASLLRSPYLIGAEAAWVMRAQPERAWLCEGKFDVTLSDAIGALDRCSNDLAARWRTARDLLHSMRRSSPREWSDAWRAWIAAAGWPGSRPLDSDEYQARVAWERLLLEFASLATVAPRLSPGRAVATLHALATERPFQPEGGPAPIQILGVLEGTGIAFDALWVAGLASDRWPSAPSPNPLLPLAWQRQRNVAHATADRECEYAAGLTAGFARAAPEVVFSSAANEDDHELSPSALILAYPERSSSPRPASWTREIARGVTLETIADDRAPPLPQGSRVPGGSRVVASQSDCPFQAVIRCRLRIEPWPRPCAGLTPVERGRLVHVALAEFWAAVRDHATLVALDEGALASRIRAAVDRALGEVPASRWRTLPVLLREGEAQRLERVMRAWLAVERVRLPFAIEALETSVQVQLAGVEFSLRRDRVDALAGGGVAVLDYKTGQVERPRQWFDDRPRSAQIGLYTLAQSVAAPGSVVRAAGYVELRPEGVAVAGLSADENALPGLDSVAIAPGGTWASLEAWWRRRLGALAEEIAAGHAAVTPRVAPSPCRNCGLQPVCRIESVRAIDPNESADE